MEERTRRVNVYVVDRSVMDFARDGPFHISCSRCAKVAAGERWPDAEGGRVLAVLATPPARWRGLYGRWFPSFSSLFSSAVLQTPPSRCSFSLVSPSPSRACPCTQHEFLQPSISKPNVSNPLQFIIPSVIYHSRPSFCEIKCKFLEFYA